jgi:L-seryl-tRNA(Ser) seleniumtransferase
MLSGREELVKKIRSNPMFRALRVDKLSYAALEATLMEYVRQNYDAIPFARMVRMKSAEVEQRARAVRDALANAARLRVEIIAGESLVGGGSAPSSTLPTFLLAITCDGSSAEDLATRLRSNNPPVVARVEEGRVLLDLRTVFEHEDNMVIEALKNVLTAPAFIPF